MDTSYSGTVVFTSFGDQEPLVSLHKAINGALALTSGASGKLSANADWFPGLFVVPDFIGGNILPDVELRVFAQSASAENGSLRVTYISYGTTGERFFQCVCDILGLSCIISGGYGNALQCNEKILLAHGKPAPYRLRFFSDCSEISQTESGFRVNTLKLDEASDFNAHRSIQCSRDILDSAGYLMSRMLDVNTKIYELTLALAVSESRKYFMAWYNNHMLSSGVSPDEARKLMKYVQSLEALGNIYSFDSANPQYEKVHDESRKLLRAMLLLDEALSLVCPDPTNRGWVQRAEELAAVMC